MIIAENDFLNSDQLAELRGFFAERDLRDGDMTAGDRLAGVKQNRELTPDDRTKRARELVLESCNRVAYLPHALLPRTVGHPILSVYTPGMYYGRHTDSAFWKDGSNTHRSDISCTVFLDDPNTYEGGELVIDTEYGQSSFKLPAGAAVFYPTLFVHQVKEVTRGRRRACVFWLESLIRDPARRSILFDLMKIGQWAEQMAPVDAPPRQTLTRVHENLYRMWLEN